MGIRSEKPWLILFVFFFLLQIGDGLSTYILTVLAGTRDIEGNPIVRFAMGRLGIIPALIALKSFAIIIGYKLIRGFLIRRTKLIEKLFIGLLVLYTAVNIYNWFLVIQLLKLQNIQIP